MAEDSARQELILNIFLLASVALLFVASLAVIYRVATEGAQYEGDPPWYIFSIFLAFVGLWLLSRCGFFRAASFIFIGIYVAVISYGLYYFGADQPETLLAFALVIVMAGVLVNSRFAFLITMLSSTVLIFLGYAQASGLYTVHAYWKKDLSVNPEDPLIFSITLAIVAIAAWLSNREIEKSLVRARRSEAALQAERDSLEATVEERTKALREAQAEKIAQLYRFAEFGQISSGIFHDLVNPLTAISLNIEKLNVPDAGAYAERAMKAARKMEGMMSAIHKQLHRRSDKALFSCRDEIEQAIDMLSYKARQSGVTVEFSCEDDITIFGDPVKFNQVMLNLVANAIDAYADVAASDNRKVLIRLHGTDDALTVSVRDLGSGIPDENLQKIFEPFFTTKPPGQGIGIGLSMTRRFMEKDFHGSIHVSSEAGKGSTFTAMIPLRSQDT